MSKKNRQNVASISQSTQVEADVRNGTAAETAPTAGLPVPSDAELDAGINTAEGTAEDVTALMLHAERTANGNAILDSDVNNRGRGNAHKSNFQAADDVAKKGPYASEAEARLPHNVYRNQGKTAWELYEVELPGSYDTDGLEWVGPDGKCYTWACNSDLAIAFVARKAGWDSSKAGAAERAPGVKAKLEAVSAELDKAKAERDELLAKLKAAGIEL